MMFVFVTRVMKELTVKTIIVVTWGFVITMDNVTIRNVIVMLVGLEKLVIFLFVKVTRIVTIKELVTMEFVNVITVFQGIIVSTMIVVIMQIVMAMVFVSRQLGVTPVLVMKLIADIDAKFLHVVYKNFVATMVVAQMIVGVHVMMVTGG